MEPRSQFTFYKSFYSAIKRIKDPSTRALAYDIICEYALTGTDPENIDDLPDSVAIAYDLMKPVLDSSREKACNGKNGGRSTSKQTGSKPEANPKQTRSKPEANPKQTGSKKEKEIESELELETENECYNSCAPDGASCDDIDDDDDSGSDTPSANSPAQPDPVFERLWSLYPRKKGKSAVSKKAIREINAAGESVVAVAIANYKAEIEKNRTKDEFVLYGSTFFNGRWRDYINPAENPEDSKTMPNEFGYGFKGGYGLPDYNDPNCKCY